MESQKSCKADFVLLGIIQSPDLVVAGAAELLGEDLHLELEPQLGGRETHLLPTPSLGVGDVCFFLTMRCFPILNDAMF